MRHGDGAESWQGCDVVSGARQLSLEERRFKASVVSNEDATREQKQMVPTSSSKVGASRISRPRIP
jgi:hypothetical protein